MLTPDELTSNWMHSDQLRPCLELGDLVEFRRVVGRVKRRIYTHWAVYIGSDEGTAYVAHLAVDDGDFGPAGSSEGSTGDSCGNVASKIVNGSKAEVRRDQLGRVANEDLCRINNGLDKTLRPFPPSIVTERAQLRLGTGGYNVLFNNCEHFVKYCRYGSRESDQATVVKTVLFGSLGFILTGSLSMALAAGCAKYTLCKIGPSLKRKYPFYPDFLF